MKAPLLQCAPMKPSPRALPPSEWRIMYLLWQHGPLTVLETQKFSPEHSVTTIATFLKRLAAKGYLTTTLEPSSPAGGRPPERFYPTVDYSAGLDVVVQQFRNRPVPFSPPGAPRRPRPARRQGGRQPAAGWRRVSTPSGSGREGGGRS
jgi:Penicillinase repressor